jgi:YD repeat-containing protein
MASCIVHAQTCGGGDPCGGGDVASQTIAAPATGAGNPIDVLTGNKYRRETDLESPAQVGLHFVRHYNSSTVTGGAFGGGWSHSYETALARVERTAVAGERAPVEIHLAQADGRRLVFHPVGTASDGRTMYATRSGANGTIEEDPSALVRTDGHGTPWIWRWTDGRHLTFAANGLLKRIEDSSGAFVALAHDRHKRLAVLRDRSGRSLRFMYWDAPSDGLRRLAQHGATDIQSSPGRLKQVQLPDGRAIRFGYELHGLLASVTYADGTQRRYEYVSVGGGLRLARVLDGSGVKAEYDYDAQGRAVASTQGIRGHRVRLEFNDPVTATDTGATVLTNGVGEQTIYSWRERLDGSRVLLEAVGPGCTSCPAANVRYAYDKRGDVIRVEHLGSASYIEHVTRDEVGRVIAREIERDGVRTRLESYEYEGARSLPARVLRSSVAPGRLHEFELSYNERDQPTAVRERGYSVSPDDGAFIAIERQTTYEYYERQDGAPALIGRLKCVDGPLPGHADRIAYEYADDGSLSAIRHPLGATEHFAYDAAGRLATYTPLDGVAIALEHDARDRIEAFTRAGLRTAIGYDEHGRMERLRDPIGQDFRFGYDDASRLTSIVDSDGNRIELELDQEGRPVARRLLSPDGSVSQEIAASPEEVARSGSRETWSPAVLAFVRIPSAHPLATPLRAIVPPLAADHADRVRRVVLDERGLATYYQYDDFGRLVRIDSPDAGVTALAYDAAGRISEKHLADGGVVRYTFDALNRPIRVSAGTNRIVIRYEANGRPSKLLFDAGSESISYDAAGRVVARELRIDGRRFVTSYRYDELGRVSEHALPTGETLLYRYNPTMHAKPGVLAAIERRDPFGTSSIVSGLNEPDDRFDLQTSRFGNGLEFRRELDRSGHLTYHGTSGIADYRFERDEHGRIAQAIGKETRSFAYDDAGRLARAEVSAASRRPASVALGFDAGGNLRFSQQPRESLLLRVDAGSNRVIARTGAGGRTLEYGYDRAGRTASIGARRFQ